jgi:cAMP phosphodiesterase
MKIELLGCSLSDPREQYLTSFLVNDHLAIDAGSLPLSITRERQLNIQHIIVTHPHLDHFAGLPLMLDNIFIDLPQTVKVYALEHTIQELHKHIFNNTIWPDFTSFRNNYGYSLEFELLTPNVPFYIGDLKVIPILVQHTVPTIGLIIEQEKKAIAFSSDTGDTEEIWQQARKIRGLKAAFMECSYPKRMQEVAERYGHLCTSMLLRQVEKLARNVPIYAYHIKPAYLAEVLAELETFRDQGVLVAQPNHPYII